MRWATSLCWRSSPRSCLRGENVSHLKLQITAERERGKREKRAALSPSRPSRLFLSGWQKRSRSQREQMHRSLYQVARIIIKTISKTSIMLCFLSVSQSLALRQQSALRVGRQIYPPRRCGKQIRIGQIQINGKKKSHQSFFWHDGQEVQGIQVQWQTWYEMGTSLSWLSCHVTVLYIRSVIFCDPWRQIRVAGSPATPLELLCCRMTGRSPSTSVTLRHSLGVSRPLLNFPPIVKRFFGFLLSNA